MALAVVGPIHCRNCVFDLHLMGIISITGILFTYTACEYVGVITSALFISGCANINDRTVLLMLPFVIVFRMQLG